MIDLSDMYASLLSGLTTRKNDKEIWWNIHGLTCTIEIIDINNCSYIMRRYNRDGSIYEYCDYVNDRPHGRHQRWNRYGKAILDANYANGNLIAGIWEK